MNTMNTTDISAVRLDGSRSLADIPHRPYGTASGLVRRHPSIGPLRLKGIASVRVLPDGLFHLVDEQTGENSVGTNGEDAAQILESWEGLDGAAAFVRDYITRDSVSQALVAW